MPAVRLRWRTFELPLRHRFEASHSTLASRHGVLLELRDEAGRVGVGEASPFPALGDGTVEDTLAILEAHAEALARDPEAALMSLPASGPGAAALRCALDTALLDLEAQRRGVPVAALLTDAPATSVAANAVIGGGTPDEVANYAHEAVSAGYEVLKLKVGMGVAADIARVEAVRAACPDARIRLDANGAWSESDAIEALTSLARLDIELCEQPVLDHAALARINAARLVRIAADEAVDSAEGAARILAAHAAELLVLKPMRLGGIRPALEIARRAAEQGVGSFVTTTFDSSIGTALALHLAAALPLAPVAHGLSTGEHLAADFVPHPLTPIRGVLPLTSTPGLGVQVDEACLEAVATGPWIER